MTKGIATQDIFAVETLFRGLVWLGLPDWRGPDAIPRSFVNNILPACKDLKTLSIRGNYTPEIIPRNMGHHNYVCRFIGALVKNLPLEVENLELRLSIPFLDYLVKHLRQSKVSLKRIGIDLGAWVQVYPLRATHGGLNENDVKKAAASAAQQARFDIYETEHSKVLPRGAKWWLPALPGPGADQVQTDDARHVFEQDFYHPKGGSDLSCFKSELGVSTDSMCSLGASDHSTSLANYLEDTRVDTLSGMLYKMYDIGTSSPRGSGGVDFFPL